MTTIHNASINSAATTADLTVSALEPHGVNAEVSCQVFSKNATSGKLFELVRLEGGQCAIVYPTTATLVVLNTSSAAGVVEVTAK